MKNSKNQNPILIPQNSTLEGHIKTEKPIRIEGNFYGTLLSLGKVIIDKSSKVHGDIVCSELIISGHFEGNIFCTGQLIVTGSSQIKGRVFTKFFQNNENCDLNCMIQIPNNKIINEICETLNNIDSETKLSTDNDLINIIQLFKGNISAEPVDRNKFNKKVPEDRKKEDVLTPMKKIHKKLVSNQYLNTL